MGLWPTRNHEKSASSSPRKRGPIVGQMDSRLRGNDVTFGGAAGDEESRTALKTRGVGLALPGSSGDGKPSPYKLVKGGIVFMVSRFPSAGGHERLP
jgi:hypothetical protein